MNDVLFQKYVEQTDLLSDEHAGDDESVHTEEAVQDVADARVVNRHGDVCGGQSRKVRRGEDLNFRLKNTQ